MGPGDPRERGERRLNFPAALKSYRFARFFRRESLTLFRADRYNLGLFGRGVEQSGSSSGS